MNYRVGCITFKSKPEFKKLFQLILVDIDTECFTVCSATELIGDASQCVQRQNRQMNNYHAKWRFSDFLVPFLQRRYLVQDSNFNFRTREQIVSPYDSITRNFAVVSFNFTNFQQSFKLHSSDFLRTNRTTRCTNRVQSQSAFLKIQFQKVPSLYPRFFKVNRDEVMCMIITIRWYFQNSSDSQIRTYYF